MPRNYTRTVRPKPYAKYTKEQISAALADKDTGFPCAQKHGIPIAVLHRHYAFRAKNPGQNMKKQGGQCVLSEKIEKLIAESLITCSS